MREQLLAYAQYEEVGQSNICRGGSRISGKGFICIKVIGGTLC